LRAEVYELAHEHSGTDLAIVNTCGFLDSAQAAAMAENGKVIVTGCMESGARKDHCRGSRLRGRTNIETVLEAVHRAVHPGHDPCTELIPPQGIKLTPRHYAYLKMSEGCNNRCTFCIITRRARGRDRGISLGLRHPSIGWTNI
jgi:ribosomal protein S12 methylthiotransferase